MFLKLLVIDRWIERIGLEEILFRLFRVLSWIVVIAEKTDLESLQLTRIKSGPYREIGL